MKKHNPRPVFSYLKISLSRKKPIPILAYPHDGPNFPFHRPCLSSSKPICFTNTIKLQPPVVSYTHDGLFSYRPFLFTMASLSFPAFLTLAMARIQFPALSHPHNRLNLPSPPFPTLMMTRTPLSSLPLLTSMMVLMTSDLRSGTEMARRRWAWNGAQQMKKATTTATGTARDTVRKRQTT